MSKRKKKPPDDNKDEAKQSQDIENLNIFDTARCPLCHYRLTCRMIKDGPGFPCPCQHPSEHFATLGQNFVMPQGTPGYKAIDNLKKRGVLPPDYVKEKLENASK